MSTPNPRSAASAAEVNKLLDDILSNPDVPVEKLTKEQIVDVQKRINLYGVVIPSDEAWANFSVVNCRENYMRKICVTALIAYLFRTASEYMKTEREDAQCPPALFEAFHVKRADLTAPEQAQIDAAYRTIARSAIDEYLQYNFNFNPDRHLRSAYKDNTEDPERVGKFQQWKEAMATTAPKQPSNVRANILLEQLKESGLTPSQLDLLTTYTQTLNADLESKQAHVASVGIATTKLLNSANKTLDTFTKSNPFADIMITKDLHDALATSTNLTPAEQTMKELVSAYLLMPPDQILDTIDLRAILARSSTEIANLTAELAPHTAHHTDGAATWLPPVDVFHHFDRFFTNHYEQLRECVNILYCDKPDIELAIQFYGKSYDTREEATAAVATIRDRVATAVFSISNEGWSLLGPFKQNRERIEFYNKNTEIIKRMMEQVEADSRLGADIMKKHVVREKHKNMVVAGPDDPGLTKYQENLGVIERLGQKPVLTKEEKEKMLAAIREKEMAEVPENAIQVDVHRPVTDAAGNTTLERTKFYTQAEAPKFMEDALRDQQAIQEAVGKGASFDQAVRTIRSRDGKISSLAELKNNIVPRSG